MMMNINKGKKKWGSIFLLLSLLVFLSVRLLPSSPKAELQVFKGDQGWGYQIVVNSKVFIYQPTIPAISADRSFPDEQSARETGLLVLKKVKAGKDFSLSTEEINCILNR